MKDGALMLASQIGMMVGLNMVFKDHASQMQMEQYYGAFTLGISMLVTGYVSGRIMLVHKLNKQVEKVGGKINV